MRRAATDSPKGRVDASFVTLRGQSRAGTCLEFAQGMNEYRGAQRDNLGQAVLNINGDDFVLENLTVKGHPRLALRNGAFADYASGSGNDTLVFIAPAANATPTKFDFNGGAILATEAAATLRLAESALP